jgi:hypothetical protein
MAYVDLNPVRSGMAEIPERSEYTSVTERIHHLTHTSNLAGKIDTPLGLHPFVGYPRLNMPKGLPFRLKDYLELLDWTSRAILENKEVHIQGVHPPILKRLQINPKHWLYMTQHFESRFKGLVGMSYTLKAACRNLGYRRTPNLGAVRQLLT